MEYFLTPIEDSLNELNAKGIKKVHNFIRKEEERETWLVVILGACCYCCLQDVVRL